MSMRVCAALVLCCVWGTSGAEVQDLAEVSPSYDETRFDDGADIHNPTSLFPGPRYGLPGYKESHEWVDDTDIFSPLIFDAKYYGLRYQLDGKSQGQLKQNWKEFLEDKTKVYPADCRQGNALFSPQKYYRANPEIKDSLDLNDDGQETCGSIVKIFLQEGILNGASRINMNMEEQALSADAAQIETEELAVQIANNEGGKRALAWPIGRNRNTFGAAAMMAGEQYTLTFWYRAMGAREPECNILHHGDNLDENSPRISQASGGANVLKFVVSQTNDNTFDCTPTQELVEKKWTFIALVVEKTTVKVLYDGQEVCSKVNTGGSTLVLPGRNFYASSPFQPPADGEIQKIQFYPNHVVASPLIEYAMEQQSENLEKLK